MAPEILKGQPYGVGVDMWSLGVIIYVMLCGFPPFDGDNEAAILCNIMSLSYEFPSPEWDNVSEMGKQFITKLLTTQELRMTAKQAIGHAWLKNSKPVTL